MQPFEMQIARLHMKPLMFLALTGFYGNALLQEQVGQLHFTTFEV